MPKEIQVSRQRSVEIDPREIDRYESKANGEESYYENGLSFEFKSGLGHLNEFSSTIL